MNNLVQSLKIELGQVWTPPDIALEMAKYALDSMPNAKHILDPACGPATFSLALQKAGANSVELTCYDVDEAMEKNTASINRALGFSSVTSNKNYLTDHSLANRFDIVIMNPPYIRQELINKDLKDTCSRFFLQTLDESVDRRSNLFVLFMLKGLVDLAPNGILCAIVYDAVTQSGYGKKTLAILNRHADLLYSRPLLAPFDGVLVDAQIMVYRKRDIPLTKSSFDTHSYNDGLVTVDDLLKVKRGTSLPLRKAYLASPSDLYYEKSTPFFIKQAKLTGLLVNADERVYLGVREESLNEGYQSWLKCRMAANNLSDKKLAIKPVCGAIAFNYYIRKAPRHLWNTKRIALADNFYVSNPSDDFSAEVAWLLLNSDIYMDRLIESARNQGNGLMKLQLYEYKQARVPDWRLLSNIEIESLSHAAISLINNGAEYSIVREIANKLAQKLLNV